MDLAWRALEQFLVQANTLARLAFGGSMLRTWCREIERERLNWVWTQ
jgi:hypothetical protein